MVISIYLNFLIKNITLFVKCGALFDLGENRWFGSVGRDLWSYPEFHGLIIPEVIPTIGNFVEFHPRVQAGTERIPSKLVNAPFHPSQQKWRTRDEYKNLLQETIICFSFGFIRKLNFYLLVTKLSFLCMISIYIISFFCIVSVWVYVCVIDAKDLYEFCKLNY